MHLTGKTCGVYRKRYFDLEGFTACRWSASVIHWRNLEILNRDYILEILIALLYCIGIIFNIIGCIYIFKEFFTEKMNSKGFLYMLIGLGFDGIAYFLGELIKRRAWKLIFTVVLSCPYFSIINPCITMRLHSDRLYLAAHDFHCFIDFPADYNLAINPAAGRWNAPLYSSWDLYCTW